MKRTLAMLLAVVMLVGMLPTLALAAGTPTITLTTDAAAAPAIGDKFSVTATLSDNPGFASITLSLMWNDKAVRFNGFQEIDDDGDILLDSFLSSYAPVYNQEKGIVTAARATNSTKNGKLFVANFEVIGTGSFDIALMKNFPDFTYADENGTDLAAAFDETAVSALCVAVPATAVSLYKNSLSMNPGATYNLIPRVTPSNSTDKLVCTSSDENVATVDANGVVTAVNAGTATITVTAGSVSASCVVTVSEKFIVQAQADGDYTKLTGTLTGITECNGKTAEDVLFVDLTADMKNVKVEVPAMAAAPAGRYNINDVRKKTIKANYSGALTFTTDDIFTAFAATPDELANALGAQVAKLGTLSDTKLYAFLDYSFAAAVSNSYCIVFAVDKTAPSEFSVTESLSLKPGKTGTIVPTVAPFTAFGTPIIWESDNTAVATVDENGVVTAVAGGSATVTATCGSLTDTCAVTVANQVMIENVPLIRDNYRWYYVREIWLGGVELKDYRWDDTTLNLFVPETTNTTASITFNLEWQGNAYSKDADVEIVNGVGSYTLNEHDVAAPVINIAPYNPATGITLNKTELSFEGKGSETLTATVTPDHSSDLVVWSTSDEKVATVDRNGLVTAVETGTATITATAGAYSAACVVTVAVPKTTVNFTGTGAEDVVGGSGQITLSGEAFKFSLNPKTGYEYTVSVGEDVHPVAAEFPFSDMNSSAVYDKCYPTAENVTLDDCMMGDTATFTVADIYIPAGLSFETGYADVLKPGGGRTGGMEFENLPDGTLLYFLDDETFEYSNYIYRIRIGAAPAAKVTLTVDAKGACTIPAEYVTGDSLTVTVTKEALPVSVNFTGTGAEDVVGGTSQTAAYGEAFSFSLNEADGYGYAVSVEVAAEGTAMEYPFKDYNSTAQWDTCFPTSETWTYNLIQSENWDTDEEVYEDVTFAVADVYIPANVVRFTTDGRARGIKPDGKGTSLFKNLPDGTMIYYYVIFDDDPIYEYSYSTYAYRIRIGEPPMEKMTLTADADGSYTIPAASVAGESLTVTVTKESQLPKMKEAAKAAIDEAVDNDTSANVVEAANAAKEAIDAAADTNAVNTAKENGLNAIQSAKDANAAAAELAEAKDDAKAAIDEAVGNDTSANVTAAASAAKEAIDAAADTDAVNAAKENGLNAIRSAKDANAAAAALAKAKDDAKAAIDEAVGNDTSANVAAAANAAKETIDAAADTDAVNTAKENGLTAIQSAKDANAAAAELAKAKDDAKAAIDEAVGNDTSANVVAAANAAKDAIDAAADTDAVNTAKENGLTAIQSAKDANAAAAELAEAKKTAADEVIAAAGENPSEEMQAIVDEAKDAIDAAETEKAVETAKNEALDKINEQKAAEADKAAAKAVDELIDAIGTVTKNSGDAIKAAREAYDALTTEQQKLVEKLDTLTAAEKKYEELTKPVDPPVVPSKPETKPETKPEKKPVNFVDVHENDYFYAAVQWAAENNVTKGVDDDHFAPDDICTRAQTVTFLWRAAGCPAPKSEKNPFADVKADAYYYEAVLWAVESGITNGVDASHFAPEATVSRAQVVTFLYRFVKLDGTNAKQNSFVDVAEGSYYYDAVLWAAENEITNGVDATHFAPALDCTRGQIVTFLYRHFA